MKDLFKIGDKVWVAALDSGAKNEKCEDCDGTGAWQLKTALLETSVTCLVCSRWDGQLGPGYTQVFDAFVSVYSDIVGQVDTREAEGVREVRYMLEGSGVGSGRVFNEKKVFSTREEAEAASVQLLEEKQAEDTKYACELRERRLKEQLRIDPRTRLQRIQDHLDSDTLSDGVKLAVIRKVVKGRAARGL